MRVELVQQAIEATSVLSILDINTLGDTTVSPKHPKTSPSGTINVLHLAPWTPKNLILVLTVKTESK